MVGEAEKCPGPIRGGSGIYAILGHMDDILAQIDATLESSEPPAFDENYWKAVDGQPPSCRNCGNPIEGAGSSTGWTHVGNWQGVRCPGLMCGATPAERRAPSRR